jgi:hypothetical protein
MAEFHPAARAYCGGMPARLLFLCGVLVVAVEARGEERDEGAPIEEPAGRALEVDNPCDGLGTSLAVDTEEHRLWLCKAGVAEKSFKVSLGTGGVGKHSRRLAYPARHVPARATQSLDQVLHRDCGGLSHARTGQARRHWQGHRHSRTLAPAPQSQRAANAARLDPRMYRPSCGGFAAERRIVRQTATDQEGVMKKLTDAEQAIDSLALRIRDRTWTLMSRWTTLRRKTGPDVGPISPALMSQRISVSWHETCFHYRHEHDNGDSYSQTIQDPCDVCMPCIGCQL